MTPLCVWDARAALGASPAWHVDDGRLYWVDIVNAQLYCFDPSTRQRCQWDLPFAATCLVAAGTGCLVAASASGFYELDAGTGSVGRRIAPGTEPGLRTNDGACDPWGSLWYGTMDLFERRPVGSFYRLQADGSIHYIWGRCEITNGPVFDLERQLVFVTDTLARRIYRAPVEEDRPGMFQLFHQFSADDGYPDGMAVDEQGGLWCAMWAGARILRLSAEGEIVARVDLPVSNPTSCAFGGSHGTTLFVTSARKGLTAEQLSREPLAGGLFAIETQVRSGPVASFGRVWQKAGR